MLIGVNDVVEPCDYTEVRSTNIMEIIWGGVKEGEQNKTT